MITLLPRLALGAAIGAVGGWILGRARTCSAEGCNVKSRRVFCLLAGAVFGAAMAWYLLRAGD